jgi:hypothetical protein
MQAITLPVRCDVCQLPGAGRQNPLLFCDGKACDIAVHPGCYGELSPHTQITATSALPVHSACTHAHSLSCFDTSGSNGTTRVANSVRSNVCNSVSVYCHHVTCQCNLAHPSLCMRSQPTTQQACTTTQHPHKTHTPLAFAQHSCVQWRRNPHLLLHPWPALTYSLACWHPCAHRCVPGIESSVLDSTTQKWCVVPSYPHLAVAWVHACMCTSAWSSATAPITSVVDMVVALSTALATSGVCVWSSATTPSTSLGGFDRT